VCSAAAPASRSTLFDALNPKRVTLPPWQTVSALVAALVAVLGASPPERERLAEAWREAALPRPGRLPPAPSGFTGREAELNAVGWYHSNLREFDAAEACCRQALELCRRHGFAELESYVWHSIGVNHLNAGRHRQALTYLNACLERGRLVDSWLIEPTCLLFVGNAHWRWASGARPAWRGCGRGRSSVRSTGWKKSARPTPNFAFFPTNCAIIGTHE
jgi:tetratricopeptide (TPR) repeat protein